MVDICEILIWNFKFLNPSLTNPWKFPFSPTHLPCFVLTPLPVLIVGSRTAPQFMIPLAQVGFPFSWGHFWQTSSQISHTSSVTLLSLAFVTNFHLSWLFLFKVSLFSPFTTVQSSRWPLALALSVQGAPFSAWGVWVLFPLTCWAAECQERDPHPLPPGIKILPGKQQESGSASVVEMILGSFPTPSLLCSSLIFTLHKELPPAGGCSGLTSKLLVFLFIED